MTPRMKVERALNGSHGDANCKLLGVTEDMPPDRWQDSCLAILSGLERHAHDHAHLY
jgi:hypothetical protein